MQIVETNPKGSFEGQKRVRIYFDRDVDSKGKPDKLGPSRNRVKPEFLKGSSIQEIINKYNRTGVVSVRPGNAVFKDFSSTADFLTQENRKISLIRYFDGLPSDIRNWFNNDVKNMLDFVLDPKNRSQAQEMGLLERDKAEEAPTPPAEPVAPAVPVPPVAPAASAAPGA